MQQNAQERGESSKKPLIIYFVNGILPKSLISLFSVTVIVRPAGDSHIKVTGMLVKVTRIS